MFRFDIKILRALRGPNRYSKNKSVFMLLDILDYKSESTIAIPNFRNKISEYLPSLAGDKASTPRKKGFARRLKHGTNIPDIILHTAIELQTLAGFSVEFGKVVRTKEKGVYVIVFNYVEEFLGLGAAEEAVVLVEYIINNKEYYIYEVINDLKRTRDKHSLSPTTQYIVAAAAARGIPYIRLNKNDYVQLGYGKYQQKIQSSITSKTSALAVEIAEEKQRTKDVLDESYIPVPEGIVAKTLKEVKDAVKILSFPIVVKPEIGDQGRGLSVNINNNKKLKTAFESAAKINKNVLVEKYLEGNEYRILVIDGKFVAASHKESPYITGDGKSTVQQLINNANSHPLRGHGNENVLTIIAVDEMTEQILKNNKLKLKSVLKKNTKLYLKTTANLIKGGTVTDVTDIVHPEIRLMAERTARVVGMDVMGIEFIGEDISKPLGLQKSGIIEINAEPDLRMHIRPAIGKSRNVAKPIIDLLFPPEVKTSIPIIAVTGTNGKTTVCKLIAHTLKYSGGKAGMASTTGVEIDGTSIVKGDYSGPAGHELVLRDGTVDFAVLETARGGILRRGLAYNECDMGVLLNVGEDHIGNDLIESVEDLGELKATVVKAVKDTGFSILNADDDIVMSHKDEAGGNKILFSLNTKNKHIQQHINDGGTSVVAFNDKIVIRAKDHDKIIADIIEVPITFSGTADFNISNTLAAVGVLYGLGLKKEQIHDGIATFYPSVKLNPGRMNVFDFNTFKVILDYGHNKHAMDALSRMLPKLCKGRKIGICHGSGNRKDELLKEFAALMAKAYDYIIITDLDIRHRKLGETAEIVHQGILDTGFDDKSIEIILDVHEAVDRAFDIVKTGDVIVIQVDKIQPVIDQVLSKKKNKSFMCTDASSHKF